MQGHTFHHAVWNIAHQYLRPVVVGGVRSRGNPKELVGIVPIGHERSVLAIDIRIVLRSHVPAAAPGFISYAPEFYIPYFISTILNAQVRHGTGASEVDILHPIRKLLDRATTDIRREVGFSSDQFAHVQEVMRTETIVFGHAAPPGIHHCGTLVLGADAVFPMVSVGKATAWPAQVGDL